MRRAVQNLAARSGYAVGTYPPPERISSFLKDLHPVRTSTPLIRLGSEVDGGYLVPDDLDGVVACFSPGVDVIASFEQAIADRGIPCFLADASVEKAPIEHPQFVFDRKFLGVWNDETTITLDTWVKHYAPPEGDLILQMDIEGAEWPVLLNVSDETLARFRIIVLEVHAVQKMLEQEMLPIMSAALGRLTRSFHVVHNHPNNCYGSLQMGWLEVPRLLELTFLRKDRANATGYETQFPHPLDRTNVPGRADVVLPKGWYRAE
jgi:hypothetical protein